MSYYVLFLDFCPIIFPCPLCLWLYAVTDVADLACPLPTSLLDLLAVLL